MVLEIEDLSPQARAERLKRVRRMAGYSRDEFAKAAGVHPSSVSFWENVTHKGLSEAGARKAVAAVAKAGVICTSHWLMRGTGTPPYITGFSPATAPASDSSLPILQSYFDEIEIFKSKPQAVVLEVPDNSMEPFFTKGDTVGGFWQTIKQIALSPVTIYIVEYNQRLVLKKISTAAKKGFYQLSAICLSPQAVTPFEITDVSLEKVAPVVRLWR